MKLTVVLVVALGLSGCAVLSPEYEDQKESLKAYHAAKMKVQIAQSAVNSANASLQTAQSEYSAAKAEMEKIGW